MRRTIGPIHQQSLLSRKRRRRREGGLDGFTLDEVTLVNSPVLPYLAMIAKVLEGRTIGITELLQVLRRSMSQRSIDGQTTTRYVSRSFDQHPP